MAKAINTNAIRAAIGAVAKPSAQPIPPYVPIRASGITQMLSRFRQAVRPPKIEIPKPEIPKVEIPKVEIPKPKDGKK